VPREVALIGEADCGCDVCNVQSSPEEPSRLVDPHLNEIAIRRNPEMDLEAIDQGGLRATSNDGECIQLDGPIEMRVDEVSHVPEFRRHGLLPRHVQLARLRDELRQESDEMFLNLQ